MSSRRIVEGLSMRTSALLLPVLAFSSGLVQAADRQLFDMTPSAPAPMDDGRSYVRIKRGPTLQSQLARFGLFGNHRDHAPVSKLGGLLGDPRIRMDSTDFWPL